MDYFLCLNQLNLSSDNNQLTIISTHQWSALKIDIKKLFEMIGEIV